MFVGLFVAGLVGAFRLLDLPVTLPGLPPTRPFPKNVGPMPGYLTLCLRLRVSGPTTALAQKGGSKREFSRIKQRTPAKRTPIKLPTAKCWRPSCWRNQESQWPISYRLLSGNFGLLWSIADYDFGPLEWPKVRGHYTSK